jgi:hypothetical protein
MRRWKIKVGQIVACSFCGEWGRIGAFSVPCKDGKLDRGRRGPALQGLDVGGYRDRFNVFKVPVPASFTPGQKLLDRAVISGPCICVADRHRKKLEELFPGGCAGSRAVYVFQSICKHRAICVYMEHTPEVQIPLAYASFHRQNALCRALREIGCLERTLFILDRISDRR